MEFLQTSSSSMEKIEKLLTFPNADMITFSSLIRGLSSKAEIYQVFDILCRIPHELNIDCTKALVDRLEEITPGTKAKLVDLGCLYSPASYQPFYEKIIQLKGWSESTSYVADMIGLLGHVEKVRKELKPLEKHVVLVSCQYLTDSLHVTPLFMEIDQMGHLNICISDSVGEGQYASTLRNILWGLYSARAPEDLTMFSIAFARQNDKRNCHFFVVDDVEFFLGSSGFFKEISSHPSNQEIIETEVGGRTFPCKKVNRVPIRMLSLIQLNESSDVKTQRPGGAFDKERLNREYPECSLHVLDGINPPETLIQRLERTSCTSKYDRRLNQAPSMLRIFYTKLFVQGLDVPADV